ncbi:hypothetical protein AAZX31_13G219500 [Glycine max]|nr:hypothetical protein GLYMA_13G236550v4 [Glycine max]KAH1103035.1 hypothetical protein GYH30_037171 [Glycine max]
MQNRVLDSFKLFFVIFLSSTTTIDLVNHCNAHWVFDFSPIVSCSWLKNHHQNRERKRRKHCSRSVRLRNEGP